MSNEVVGVVECTARVPIANVYLSLDGDALLDELVSVRGFCDRELASDLRRCDKITEVRGVGGMGSMSGMRRCCGLRAV